MNIQIIIPVWNYNQDYLLQTARNLKDFPVTYVVQQEERIARILQAQTKHNVIRAWRNGGPLSTKSKKVTNQLIGIAANTNADCFIFIDADCLVTEEAVVELIAAIASGSKVATGWRYIASPALLTGWSLTTRAARIGVYGGLFAVEANWFFVNCHMQESQTDDWLVDTAARATGTKIAFTSAKAICKEETIIRFLICQYGWLKLYRKNFFLGLLLGELICLAVPLKAIYLLLVTKSIKQALLSIPAQFAIVYSMLAVLISRKKYFWK